MTVSDVRIMPVEYSEVIISAVVHGPGHVRATSDGTKGLRLVAHGPR
ncbi:MAG TPA: hypothetical protein VIY52_27985 [Streptosporangiaceae bacterium]